jgi:CRP/FNR family transcriptional regulator, anaerobic regulatory protein
MALPLPSQIDLMNKIAPMPEGLKVSIFREAARLDLPKKYPLLKPGEICDNLYFIQEGILSCYELAADKRYYNWLMLEGDIATAVNSFNQREPSNEYIETLTACVLYLLSWQQVEKLCQEHAAFAAIRLYYTNKYHMQIRGIEAIRRRGARELYDHLEKTNPNMIAQVPNTVLASYIGVSESKLYQLKREKRNYK